MVTNSAAAPVEVAELDAIWRDDAQRIEKRSIAVLKVMARSKQSQ